MCKHYYRKLSKVQFDVSLAEIMRHVQYVDQFDSENNKLHGKVDDCNLIISQWIG